MSRRTVFGSPLRSPDGSDRDPDRLGMGGRDDIMMRFADMLYQMSAGQHPASPGGPGGPGGPGREPNFPPRPERTIGDITFGGPRSFGDILGGSRPPSPGERPTGPPLGAPLGIAAILQMAMLCGKPWIVSSGRLQKPIHNRMRHRLPLRLPSNS